MHDGKSGERYPGYDVLAKRNTPSWNEKTRQVIDQRLSVPREPRFFTAEEFATVVAIAARIVPQRGDRPHVPVAALIDNKLYSDRSDGYRNAGMPREREAWRQGLQALDAEARRAHGGLFREISGTEQNALLKRMEQGELHGPEWGSIPPKTFFKKRMAHDVVLAYFSWPSAWNDIGWGGPASPRGYVRLDFDERDPWEAAEVKNGDFDSARRKNRHVR
jgi:hypothetical protein